MLFQAPSLQEESLDTIKENCLAAGVRLEETFYRLGRVLDFDETTERFIDDDQANTMLTRDYRQPFVVPERV